MVRNTSKEVLRPHTYGGLAALPAVQQHDLACDHQASIGASGAQVLEGCAAEDAVV